MIERAGLCVHAGFFGLGVVHNYERYLCFALAATIGHESYLAILYIGLPWNAPFSVEFFFVRENDGPSRGMSWIVQYAFVSFIRSSSYRCWACVRQDPWGELDEAIQCCPTPCLLSIFRCQPFARLFVARNYYSSLRSWLPLCLLALGSSVSVYCSRFVVRMWLSESVHELPPRRARTKCSVAPPSRAYSSAVLSSALWREKLG